MFRASRLILSLSLRAAGLVVLGLALAAIPALAAADDPRPIDIGAARQLPLGTVVTVEGSVTVPSGDFSSSSFDEGFAIQDHTGGIYVSVATNLGLTVRQRVLATGQLVDSFGVITQPVVPDPPFGDKVFVDDGSGPIRIFVNTSTGIDVSALAQGQLLSVIGFSSAFNDPEIDPRFQSDLRQPANR
jgi:hypothetical protein